MGGPWEVYRGIQEASKHRGGKRREGRKQAKHKKTRET